MLTKRISFFLAAGIAASVLLTGCGAGNKVRVGDQLIEVGQTVEPEVTFTPASSVDSYVFTVADETVISISGHVILGLEPGEATVKVETVNTKVSSTFKVTVTAAAEDLSVKAFNEAGTFENGLPGGWTLLGPTAEVMDVDTDGDRGQDDYQLKLWTDGLVDFTLQYTISDLAASEDGYTVKFDVVAGALNSFTFSINDTEYSWLESEITLGSSGYVTNYFHFDHPVKGNVTFSLYVYAELRTGESETAGWGYIDDIKLEKGDTRPEAPQGYQDYVVNGSFENNLTSWIEDGVFSTGATHTISSTAKTGTKAFNFWNNNRSGSDFNIRQDIAAVPAGSKYEAHVFVINGELSTPLETTFYVVQGENRYEVSIETKSWGAGYTEYVIENIVLTATEPVTIGLHVVAGTGNIWMHVDDIKLLNLNEPIFA